MDMLTIYRGASLLPVLLAGCFNPDYGDGGFLCGTGDKTCPDGYTCVRENNQEICRRDDLVVVRGPEQPSCGSPQPVAGDLMVDNVYDLKAPNVYSLAVTRKEAPVVVYVSKAGTIKLASFHEGKWVSETVPLASGDMVATTSTKSHTVVVHGQRGKANPMYTSADLHAPSLRWAKAQRVEDITDAPVTSVDMASARDMGYLAVTTGALGDSSGVALEYRAGKGFQKICSVRTTEKTRRFTGARVGASTAGMAYSMFQEAGLPGNRQLVVEKMTGTDKSCTTSVTMGTVGATGVLEPLIGVAVPDDAGAIHVATPTAKAAKQNGLSYSLWDGKASTVSPKEKWDDNVHAASVDMATSSTDDDVVITFRDAQGAAMRHKNNKWHRVDLQNVEGHSTRVAVGLDGTIHVVWDKSIGTTKTGELYYRCFKTK